VDLDTCRLRVLEERAVKGRTDERALSLVWLGGG